MASYSGETSVFKIPIPLYGDSLSGTLQKKVFNIIENQLVAAMADRKSIMFADGTYNTLEHDGLCDVYLNANTNNPSVFGLLNGGLVYSNSTISWKNMYSGYLYYLYLEWNSDGYVYPDVFQIVAFTSPQTNDTTYLLMATLDYTGITPVLNTIPFGKVYSIDIKSHLLTGVDPHGTTLYQTYLSLLKNMTVTITDNGLTTSAIVIDDQRVGIFADIESKQNLRLKNQYSTVNLSDVANAVLTTINQTLIGAINEIKQNIDAHKVDYANPHQVTLSNLGVFYSGVQVNTAVSKAHIINTDTYMNFGGPTQVSAAETRTHLDDVSIHREINDSITSTTSLWSSQKISLEIPRLYVADIVSRGPTGNLITVPGATSIEYASATKKNVTKLDYQMMSIGWPVLNAVYVVLYEAHGWSSGDTVTFPTVCDPVITGNYVIQVPLTPYIFTEGGEFYIIQAGATGCANNGNVQLVSSVGGLSLGMVAIGYYGEDGSVMSPDQIKVYNSGDSLIPLKLIVKYF